METNFKSLRFSIPPLIGMLSFATFLIIDPRYNFINLITEYGAKIEYIFGTIFLIIALGYIIGGITIILAKPFSCFCWKGTIGWHYEIPIKRKDVKYLSQKLMGLDKKKETHSDSSKDNFIWRILRFLWRILMGLGNNKKAIRDFAVTEIFLHLVLPKISPEIYDYVSRGWHAFATALNCITSIIIFSILKFYFCSLDKITVLENINFYSLRPMNQWYTSLWFTNIFLIAISFVLIILFLLLANNSRDYLKNILSVIIRNKSLEKPIKNILKLKDPDFKTVNLPKNAVL